MYLLPKWPMIPNHMVWYRKPYKACLVTSGMGPMELMSNLDLIFLKGLLMLASCEYLSYDFIFNIINCLFIVYRLFTHHFAESRRIFERVFDVNERSSFVVVFALDRRQFGAEIFDVRAQTFDRLQSVAKISIRKSKKNVLKMDTN